MPDDGIPVEEWRPVVGWEGWYEVSDLGRVRSLERVTRFGTGTRVVGNRILNPGKTHGYPSILLYAGPGKRKLGLVHRLVLEVFVGPCPAGMQACHKNDIGTDNRIENLRWDTPQRNIDDRCANGGTARGERSGVAKLCEEDVREIRRAYAEGESQSSIGRRFGVGQNHVSRIVLGESWRHVISP